MKTKIDAIAKELNIGVQLKELEFSDVKTDARPIILLLKEGFERVKNLISNYEFESKDEEIFFFKETKPKMFYKLVYYNKIYNIEQLRPACGYEAIKEYLEKEQMNCLLLI